MKLILLTLFVALCGATFVDFLNNIMNHHSFQRLPPEDKLLFGELVVAAENDELKEFIDRTGLQQVLTLMDHMSSSDAAQFAAYLAEHSNYTHHAHGNEDVVNKRDDDDHHRSLLSQLMHHHTSSFSNLPQAEKNTLDNLVSATQNRRLNEYIAEVGYGAIFGLLEYLDGDHASALIEINDQYYEKLPEPERQTYHDLKNAAENKTLTAYIDANGYGPIFGFIEHLDYIHANQVYDYIAKALQAEADAASAAGSN